MANGPKFVKTFAEITGSSFAVTDKLMSTLIAARVLPPSGKGGGKRAVHYDHWDAALWILGCAATGANTAVDTVRQLKALEWVDPQPGDFGDLSHILAAEIEIRARHIYNGKPPTGPHDAPGWRLTICHDPLSAWMEWTRDGKPQRRDFATPGDKQARRRSIRRLTEIDRDVLNAAAELCADSLAQTAPQRETAANPARKAAAVSGSRSSPPDTPTVALGRVTEKTGYPQGRTDRAPGNLPRKTRPRSGHERTAISAFPSR
jgi:hypothetical protein